MDTRVLHIVSHSAVMEEEDEEGERKDGGMRLCREVNVAALPSALFFSHFSPSLVPTKISVLPFLPTLC